MAKHETKGDNESKCPMTYSTLTELKNTGAEIVWIKNNFYDKQAIYKWYLQAFRKKLNSDQTQEIILQDLLKRIPHNIQLNNTFMNRLRTSATQTVHSGLTLLDNAVEPLLLIYGLLFSIKLFETGNINLTDDSYTTKCILALSAIMLLFGVRHFGAFIATQSLPSLTQTNLEAFNEWFDNIAIADEKYQKMLVENKQSDAASTQPANN